MEVVFAPSPKYPDHPPRRLAAADMGDLADLCSAPGDPRKGGSVGTKIERTGQELGLTNLWSIAQGCALADQSCTQSSRWVVLPPRPRREQHWWFIDQVTGVSGDSTGQLADVEMLHLGGDCGSDPAI